MNCIYLYRRGGSVTRGGSVALEEPDGANCRQQRVIDLVPSGECQQHLLISSKQQA